MVADFAQFYGIVLDISSDPDNVLTLASLWLQLPRESRCVRVGNPDAEWDDADQFLWKMEHLLRVLVWQQTKDGSKGRNQPKPMQTPGEHARNEAKKDHALANRNEIDRILGIGGE